QVVSSVSFRISPSEAFASNGFLAPFPGANADHVVDRRDEDLAVADTTRARRLRDDLRRARGLRVVEEHFDLDLRQEVDDVLRPSVELRVPLLPPEPLHL